MEDGKLLKGKREIVENWLVSQMLNHSQPTKLPETQHHYSHHISTDFETVNKEATTLAKKVSIIHDLCFSILSHLILQFLAVLSPNNGENSWGKNM